MVNKFRALLITIVSSLTLLAPAIAVPALVHAAPSISGGLNCGSNLQFTDNTTGCASPGSDATSKINNIITLVINIFSVVVGIIAVIMIIVGGIRFILSGGDSTATGAARNTVLYAVVGLIIVALAQIIVRYVLARVNSSTS